MSCFNLSWRFDILLLGLLVSMISHQLVCFKLFLRAFIFLVRVSLVVIRMGTRLLNFRFFIDTILGRWSLILFTSTPLLYFSSHDWLMKMLSIRVAVLFVMRVRRVIVGTRFNVNLHLRSFPSEHGYWILINPCYGLSQL